MIDLIPVQYRMLAALVGVLIVFAIGATAGAIINGCRLDAKYTRQLAEKDAYIAELDKTILHQNTAVEILNTRKQMADQARDTAEKTAKLALQASVNRAKQADTIQAIDCRGMLDQLKSLPR